MIGGKKKGTEVVEQVGRKRLNNGGPLLPCAAGTEQGLNIR